MNTPNGHGSEAGRPAAAAEARRFAAYLAVGAFATAVHYALLVAAVEWAHWPAWLASGAGAVVGAQVAFVGNRWFTFSRGGTLAQSWPPFQLTALAGAGIGMLIVALAVHWQVHYLAGQVLATGTVVLVTYAINRRWTFAATRHRT